MKLENRDESFFPQFRSFFFGRGFHDIKEKEGITAVFTAIESGINFIDVSPYYGHYKAETVLGKP